MERGNTYTCQPRPIVLLAIDKIQYLRVRTNKEDNALSNSGLYHFFCTSSENIAPDIINPGEPMTCMKSSGYWMHKREGEP